MANLNCHSLHVPHFSLYAVLSLTTWQSSNKNGFSFPYKRGCKYYTIYKIIPQLPLLKFFPFLYVIVIQASLDLISFRPSISSQKREKEKIEVFFSSASSLFSIVISLSHVHYNKEKCMNKSPWRHQYKPSYLKIALVCRYFMNNCMYFSYSCLHSV